MSKKTDQEKEEIKKKWDERGKKAEETGEKMKKWGCALTVLLTVPIALTAFFGVPGAIISAGIVILYLVGRKKQDKEGD